MCHEAIKWRASSLKASPLGQRTFEFATEAAYQAHIKMCTTSFRAETFYSIPAGIFAIISNVKQPPGPQKTKTIFVPQCLREKNRQRERKTKKIISRKVRKKIFSLRHGELFFFDAMTLCDYDSVFVLR